MIETLQNIDTQVFLALNSLRCEPLDGFILRFSGQWIWVAMYVVLAWMMVRRFGWRRGLIFIAAVGLAVGCADFVCASVIRPFAQRLRPANLDSPISDAVQIVAGYRGGKYGFPSCHAANTLCLALLSSLLIKERAYTIFIFSWAILQCYSRIYLGVHYPGDLLVGALVGLLLALIAYAIIRRTCSITPERHAPLWPLLSVFSAILLILIII